MTDEYIKDFDKWNEHAKILDSKSIDFVFSEGELWWCALGVNIGSEQDGKGDDFVRPVLLLKKINRDTVLIIPVSSKLKTGACDRVSFDLGGQENQFLISQARMVSSKRFIRRIHRVKSIVFLEVIVAIIKFILF